MTDPPFSIALSLTLLVSDDRLPVDLRRADWRRHLRYVASRDAGSRRFSDNQEPTQAEAMSALAAAFANHPMVNVTGRLADGGVEYPQLTQGPHALVIAEVIRRGGFAEIKPGGEYPVLNTEPITDACLIHAELWEHERGAKEHEAARELLGQIGSRLPNDWIDGD